MAIYEVKFKRVACTQGNWDGTVEPIVTVSAESAENAAIVAERRLFEDAERDHVANSRAAQASSRP